MIRLGLFELPKDVGPTRCELDPWAFSGARFVRLESIANDDAFVGTDEIDERAGSLIVLNPMADNLRRRDAPHLPRFALALESLPTRLIEPDDPFAERACQQRVADRLELGRDGVDLVPQRLRRDHHAVAPKDALLPRERDVVLVLVDHHLDGEVQ